MTLFNFELYKSSDLVIGCDEVGVGEYFTNLTVSCAAFVENEVEKVLLAQIVDSKLLTEKKIADLFQLLKPKITFEFLVLEMEEYNNLIKKGLNSHEIKSLLYFKILSKIVKNFDGKTINKIFIDGFVSEAKFLQYLEKIANFANFSPWNLEKYPLILEKKADTKIKQVAAASIIAKFALSQKFAQRQAKWQAIFPAGSNQITKIVDFCVMQINKHGEVFLEKNVKMHFSITNKIYAKLVELRSKNG
ncbi:ribonuclease HIII [Mycoplasma sp. 'Moose RK']|uniref:ribonuclease HIII n=1 Tax=Mycoplasma sp. 'Moose RK' TaxID=2780095 RepID=UPI0018C32326|nr:ribonuclease HIII [Mycoplasma sp. 'Moose RK']MBG0731067.1 ribonuclease HIII [Mycoplasma sp. 'Moose RK']